MQKASHAYEAVLRERVKSSRVYREYQSTGLELAELLHDPRHKTLYFRLAKMYPRQFLMALAKDVISRREVKNCGAYFMRLLQHARNKPRRLPSNGETEKKRKKVIQLHLSLRRKRKKYKSIL